MSDDLIPMGNDLGGDGPSFSPDTSAPDAGADDHGLAGLDQALGGGGGQQFTPAPAQAPQQRPQPQTGQRAGAYRHAQRTWSQRNRERNQQLEQLRAEREGYAAQMREVAELLKGVAGSFPQQQKTDEPPPDPMLDPGGFQAWWTKQNSSMLDERLKPLMDNFAAIKANQDAAAQREQQSYQQQQMVQQTEGMLVNAQRAYEEQFPELAYGAEDRITSGLETLSRVFENQLGWGSDGAAMAQRVTLAIAQYAQAGGENPAAAVDAFYTGLIQEVADGLHEFYAAQGIELPPFFVQMGQGAQQPTYQPAPAPQQPNPAARENQRLQQVRQRAQNVANPRPRQPARGSGNQPTSQAWALAASYRAAGQSVDWNRVAQVAKQEAGGNLKLAQQIMQQIPAA